MILSFRCSETERFWNGRPSRRLPAQIQPAAQRKLRILDAASTVDELRNPPGNRLEALKGNRKGQFSIRINAQWRLCFRWPVDQGGPSDVEIVDYHD